MFDWDAGNRWKVENRHLTLEQVEAAFADPYRLSGLLGIVNGEERYVLLGAMADGRVIKAVYTFRRDAIRIVTAYHISKGKEFRAYRSQFW